jgi:hypothetical protein
MLELTLFRASVQASLAVRSIQYEVSVTVPKPLTDAKRAEILRLRGQGLSRDEIVRHSGVSTGPVTKVSKEAGAGLDRSKTKGTTKAKKVDLAGARMNLAYRLNTVALDVLDLLDKAFEVFNFGVKDHTFLRARLGACRGTAHDHPVDSHRVRQDHPHRGEVRRQP